jgi:hypothetical protein
MYVGIDPGESGGIAVISVDAVTMDRSKYIHSISTYAMPATEPIRLAVIREIVDEAEGTGYYLRVCIERVTGFIPPRKGTDEEHAKHSGNPGSSMFVFGQNYGGLRMALIACGLREEEDWKAVNPGHWQKCLGIPPRARGNAETKPQFKRRLKEFACSLYPEIRHTLQTADALLIAEYCRKTIW